jgi:DNA-binding protein HU-beta
MVQSATLYTSDIIKAVSREEMLPENLVTRVISATLREITRELARGRKVQLSGFGTFYKAARKAGRARDFKTGDMIDVPATALARFTAGRDLKQAVRRK